VTLIEELLELFEQVYAEGLNAADGRSDESLTAQESAQKAVEHLKRDMRCYVSMGDERQVEDPRSKYVDVQVELDFYDWLWGDYRD
jgi:hypothetical protein